MPGKNTFIVKRPRPSKVESYLKVNAWRDQWQQDLISAKAHSTEYINAILDTLCFQSLVGLVYKFHILTCRLTREHEIHNFCYLATFFYLYVVTDKKADKGQKLWTSFHLSMH